MAGVWGSIELAKSRLKHDLWDRTAARVSLTFSISQLLIWASPLAVLIADYQNVQRIKEWLV
jgi:hypothetical protein